MGNIADLIIKGVLCEQCGCLMEDLIQPGTNQLKESPGYPRSCPDCTPSNELNATEQNKG